MCQNERTTSTDLTELDDDERRGLHRGQCTRCLLDWTLIKEGEGCMHTYIHTYMHGETSESYVLRWIEIEC